MQDVRLAFRALRATPIVNAVAILSLALGVGANTAIFSLVNSLLLRTLPVKEPQRLVAISTADATNRGSTTSLSNPVWEQLRQRQLFEGAVAWAAERFVLLRAAKHSSSTVSGSTAPFGRTFDVAVPIGDEPLLRGRETSLDGRTNYWLSVIACA